MDATSLVVLLIVVLLGRARLMAEHPRKIGTNAPTTHKDPVPSTRRWLPMLLRNSCPSLFQKLGDANKNPRP